MFTVARMCLTLAALASASLPREPSAKSPSVPSRLEYDLRVDSATSDVFVELRVFDAPAEFRLAMATHAEYDDEYWRYVANLRGKSRTGPLTVTREDSAVWRINGAPGYASLRYRVRFPEYVAAQRASWKGHFTDVGGLAGGPHSFLYVVGAEHVPIRVTVLLPPGWAAATGLDSVAPHTYAAPHADALIDSPIMVGRLRQSRFDINGVPHDVAFLGATGGAAFDTTSFTRNLERLARTAVDMFGTTPYRRYQFLFEDASSGGLEHLNSVSIGVQSTNLSRDPNASLSQIAHEFFHTWNEVHVRPAEWVGLRHTTPAPTGVLWFSEGVTLYFADLLLRRAGLHTTDSTRTAHLERLMTMYHANPSHAAVSPEATSRAFNMLGATGDYTPGMFIQGEILGTVLDLMIRERSAGRRSLDDVMRALVGRFNPARGISSSDVEREVASACGCDARPFFDTYVRNAAPLDFDRWLGVLGLRSVVTWTPARGRDSVLAPDTRVSAYQKPGESRPRLQIWAPATIWGRAGLHTGDEVVSWNGAAFENVQQFRTAISALRIGDVVRVRVLRNSQPIEATVTLGGFDRPVVRIEERPDATDAQRRLRAAWVAGR